MPLYEYICLKCGVFEKFTTIRNCLKKQRCKCGKMGERIISSLNFASGPKNFTYKGREIKTWKDWEKSGFKDPLQESYIPNDVKDGIREKTDKIKSKKRLTVNV